MKLSFTPEHILLNDFFGKDIRYIIPSYQRPYSWESLGKSDKNNQVNLVWSDLIAFYKDSTNQDEEYFFGSMVMIEKNKREFEVVDGQQRLTTLILLLVAIKCFLSSLQDNNNEKLGNQPETKIIDFIKNAIQSIDDTIYNKDSLDLSYEKKVKIEKIEDFDYDIYLKKSMECMLIDNEDLQTNLKSLLPEHRKVVKRYFTNRDYFTEEIYKEFLNKHGFFDLDSAKRLNDFVRNFLNNGISIVRIKTPAFNIAYKIFEILNNRGLPLTNKDLFRNFIISEFDKLNKSKKGDSISPVVKWQELDRDNALSNEFIARWTEVRNASQPKYSAYNDLLEIYNSKYQDGIDKQKIEIFHEDIKKDLEYFLYIENPDLVEDKQIKLYEKIILKIGNERYSQNLMLCLFRKLDYNGGTNSEISEFLLTYLCFMLYKLLAPQQRFSSKPIYEAIRILNNSNLELIQLDKTRQAMELFQLDVTQKDKLKNTLNAKITDNFSAKALIALYILHEEYKSEGDVVEQILDYKKATLEHIIPQQPALNTNWFQDFSKDFKKEYTYKLGNMTLLVKGLNSKLRNYDFIQKRDKGYKKSLLVTTAKLAELTTTAEKNLDNNQKQILDEEYIATRHQAILSSLYEILQLA